MMQKKSYKKKFSPKFILFFFFFTLIISNSECFSFDYLKWWENWYANGGTSGPGSQGILAQHKADVINDFIDKHKINSVVEFGCGDGVILQLINYKEYLGFDISRSSIKLCASKFTDDYLKSFMLYTPQCFINNTIKNVDLVVCLDVLYHVIDENDYFKLLDDIFSFSPKHIIIYTILSDKPPKVPSPEILYRNVLEYLEKRKNYEITIIKQKYPKLSAADFVFLTKKE